MEGKGILYYASGKIAYDGEWKQNKFEGEGTLYNEMPEMAQEPFDFSDMEKIEDYWVVYQGAFKDDNKHGYGVLALSNGEKFIGQFQEDQVHGEGVYYTMRGEEIKGIWENNLLMRRF